VDNATKRQLKKQDQFISLTDHSIEWASKNRQAAAGIAGLIVVIILGAVGGYTWYEHRSAAAATAFGAAMNTYQTPVATPGQALPPGMKSFATVKERAAAANAEFNSVAHQYGLLHSGKLALYFAGLTYMEEGQNGSAEETLKTVAGSWDQNIAALAELSLANLYQQTGRNDQAADIYNKLSDGKSATVPPTLAQLQLAEMYSSEGKTAEARQIYAKLKDKDKDAKGNPGPAASIAEEKLNPKAQPLQ
jgi:predicted negative regulator of RcsB-dependent stress response